MKDILQHINQFEATSLGEMNAIKLLNRQDTKYIFHQRQLPDILDGLCDSYKMLEIDGVRLSAYQNIYFDTKDFTCYNMHQRGMLNRTKVRIRTYVESDLSFIEIKTKTNKSRTIKKRIPLEKGENLHSGRIKTFVDANSPFLADDLTQEIHIDFERLTLAHKDLKDRCTLDLNLRATWNGQTHYFDKLVIAELKQDRFKNSSPFNLTLKKHKVYAESFSKYCFSFLELNDQLKRNNFKPKIQHLNKTLS